MHSESADRRSPRARRVELETLVEICGRDPDVPAFEARSVEISGRGMQVRTRHLPEVGTPLVLRFERDGNEVLVEGEVAWREGDERGGQFGVKFTALDSSSVAALKALCQNEARAEREAEAETGEDRDQPAPYLCERGAAVKLHIQGLAAPMKARVFRGSARKLQVGSQLEFLKVGRELELEDVSAGSRRAAEIDTVSVSIDPETQIPQLVVSLRYDGVDEDTPEPTVVCREDDADECDDADEDEEEITEDLFKGKVGAIAANAERAIKNTSKHVARWSTQAFSGFGRAVKSVADRSERPVNSAKGQQLRRTSRAPAAPSARRRTSSSSGSLAPRRAGQGGQRSVSPPPRRSPKWWVYAAATVSCVAGAYALFADRGAHPAPEPLAERTDYAASSPTGMPVAPQQVAPVGVPPVAAPGYAGAAPGVAAAAAPELGPSGLPVRAPLDTREQLQQDPRGVIAQVPLFGATPMATAEPAPLNPAPAAPTLDEYSMSKDQAFDDRVGGQAEAREAELPKQAEPTVFQLGRMELPIIHRLRLDGPGTALQGSETPSGFSVLIPGRKVMESGSGIANRDDRIIDVRVQNTPAGGKVTFRFRKDIPGYKARLRNDYVEFFINSPKKR